MLKKYFYPVFISSFLVMIGLIVVFGKRKPQIPDLKERKVAISPASEWVNTKAAIEGLKETLRKEPNNLEAKSHLALAYIQESRVTGDHAYYDKAALQLVNEVLKENPRYFEALCGKATVYLSQHHFAESLEVAQQAVALYPHNAFVYGLLVDAYVELGDYTKAVQMAEKMIDIRPDIRSYARVSYLREIHGDFKGAIEAMDMAVKAGFPGMEQTAWTRVNLGHLYEKTGKLKEAYHHYELTLAQRPNYAYALAGMGRIEKTKNNYPKAIQHFTKASEIIQDYSFTMEIADIYNLTNESTKAKESLRLMMKEISDGHPEGDNENHEIGHYADMELAYAYLKTNELNKALSHATAEYNRRPHNIDVNEALAWVHYKRKAYKEAEKYMDVAMRTKSQNPVLLYRAGLIKMKAGATDNGIALLEKALSINPFLPLDLQAEGQKYVTAIPKNLQTPLTSR